MLKAKESLKKVDIDSDEDDLAGWQKNLWKYDMIINVLIVVLYDPVIVLGL